MEWYWYVILGSIALSVGIYFIAMKNSKVAPDELANEEEAKVINEFAEIFDEPMVKPAVTQGGESIKYDASVVVKLSGMNVPPKFEDMSVKEIQQAVSEMTGVWIKLDRYIEDKDEYKRAMLKTAMECLEHFESQSKEEVVIEAEKGHVDEEQAAGRVFRNEDETSKECMIKKEIGTEMSPSVTCKQPGPAKRMLDNMIKDNERNIPDMSAWNERKITNYVFEETGIDILQIDNTENVWVTSYNQWKIKYILLAKEQLNNYYDKRDAYKEVQNSESEVHPAIPNFENRNCTEIGEYVIGLTGTDPAMDSSMKAYIADYVEYKQNYIKTAQGILNKFYAEGIADKLPEETGTIAIEKEIVNFNEMSTIEIADYVLETTGIDPKLIANDWDFEPDYSIYKTNFIKLSNDIIEAYMFETQSQYAEHMAGFDTATTKEITKYVKDITNIDIKKNMPQIEDYDEYKLSLIFTAKSTLFDFHKGVDKIAQAAEKIEFIDMDTTEIVDYVESITGRNAQRIVYELYGHPDQYSEYKRYVTDIASQILAEYQEDLKITDGGQVISQRLKIAIEPAYAVDAMKESTAETIDSKNIEKLPEHLNLLKHELGTPIDEHMKQWQSEMNKAGEHIEMFLKTFVPDYNKVLSEATKVTGTMMDFTVIKEAEEVYKKCKEDGNFQALTTEIDLLKADKIKFVKEQSFEKAANTRETEREYLYLLMKIEGGDIKGHLSDERADELLQEFTTKELEDVRQEQISDTEYEERMEDYLTAVEDACQFGQEILGKKHEKPVGIKDDIVALISKQEILPGELTVPGNKISYEQYRHLHNTLETFGIKTIYEQLNKLSSKELQELLHNLK